MNNRLVNVFTTRNNIDNQFKNKKWAHITVDNVRKSMRHVLENPKEIETKANNGLLMVKENFKYEVVANKIKQIA